MNRRHHGPRIYWRERGGAQRAYGDFRAYADVGGSQEALVAPGTKLATTDPAIAQALLAERVKQLEAARRGRALHGLERGTTLSSFAREHLIAKARAGRTTTRWLALSERFLNRAVSFFGADRDVASVTVANVREWVTHLQQGFNGRGGGLSGGTIRHHLNTLSNLFRRAQAEGFVIAGYNPVAALMEKPSARRQEARWLEVHEAALILESARTAVPAREDLASQFAYPLVATFLLTGGRAAEVLGLEVQDVSFDRRTITFRPNEWRRLKTGTSFRAVPLWPQLDGILRAYVFGSAAPPGRLLFPSFATGRQAMLVDVRKLLDRVAVPAGWKPGEIRSKMFRHTYCAARLQTLDRGAPVSAYTVAQELGHGGDSLVRRVYGHIGHVRQRSEAVEYRVEAYSAELADRLTALARVPTATRPAREV